MIKRIVIILLLCLTVTTMTSAADQDLPTVKKERNHIRAGNNLFNKKRYAEAEVEYRKALQVAPQSAIAQFNLATALLKQGGGSAGQDDKNNPVKQAADMLTQLAKNAPTKSLRSKANYDLGNLAYAGQDYAQAVQLYKQALRENPSDDQARYNLRMAQLKLKQQQQNQNKDKNQNQDKKDQEKKDQDKKDQDQQKQDQQKQDQQQDQKDQNQPKQDQPKQQQQGGMSQQNAEQVLKTMQNQENATQQRINAARAQQERRERARTNRKW
ncbi:MAG: tetratricopeptide repeat protein [Muribaculaceae bacterium]|nr:tetratricopeptide repeat protein [Muribaculaceae bacterium]